MRTTAVLLVVALLLTGCLRKDVDYLSRDALGGRAAGSSGSLLAQDYIIERLQGWSIGANSEATGVEAYHQDFAAGRNIVAIIPGTDLAHEYVMIGAHYDGVASCRGQTAEDLVCNATTDNAAGTALVLSLAERLGTWEFARPRRSVIVAFWDAEEIGLLGSKAYVADPLVPLEDTVAYLNFDVQGANLRASIASNTFAVGAETGGSLLTQAVRDAAEPSTLDTRLLSLVFGQGRSDYAPLAAAGVPVVSFTDSSGPCYHHAADDLAALDRVKLAEQLETGSRLAFDLTRRDDKPTFDPGAPLVTFDDAVSMGQILTHLRSATGEFSPEDQAALDVHGAALDAVLAAGPEAFDDAAVTTLALGALAANDMFTRGECQAFLPDR